MATITRVERRKSGRLLGQAVHQNKALSGDGLAERAFSLAFRHMVYPQIWEDPVVDMAALALTAQSRIVTIASGGCNALSYLTADPAHITAVDLNSAHIALNRLKLHAAQRIDEHRDFYRFFGEATGSANVELFDRALSASLDSHTRRFWNGRDVTGRRRITWFARGFYRFGLLGRFITASHFMARRFGVDPSIMMQAQSLEHQQQIFDQHIAPVFDKRMVRWLLNNRSSLYGLGIPPAQYEALVGDSEDGMAPVVRDRLKRLACGYDLKENYFAWQAFARRYPKLDAGPVPLYLQAEHFEAIKQRSNRIDVRLISITQHLREQPAASVDRYILLDAQDWMSDEILIDLWREITRTARADARVIFRTAGVDDILPGRVPDELLNHWYYDETASVEHAKRDRSAIYGGFHLYRLARPAS